MKLVKLTRKDGKPVVVNFALVMYLLDGGDGFTTIWVCPEHSVRVRETLEDIGVMLNDADPWRAQ